jgi:hypothetical protein
MYTIENTHRFPALVLAATFTTAVMIGLSALAQSYAGTSSADVRQIVAATPSSSEAMVAEAAPLRITVIASRS